MLARISGTLSAIETDRMLVDIGPMTVAALVPACDLPALESCIGQMVERHTLLILEGASVGSTITPRLLAFASEQDRAFFELFTTVKNIGHRKAMRALDRPISDVAAAIAAHDTATLTTLPGIGKRAAETIIAELDGKVDAFTTGISVSNPATGAPLSSLAEDTIAMLVALGENRAMAQTMVERARAVMPDAESPEALLGAVYALREPAP